MEYVSPEVLVKYPNARPQLKRAPARTARCSLSLSRFISPSSD